MTPHRHLTHTMSSATVASYRTRRTIEIDTAFSGFLEFPKELQIQIWQKAIVESFDKRQDETQYPYMCGKFVANLGFKIIVTNSVERGSLFDMGRRTNLFTPPFIGVYGTCCLARLIVCQWWRDALKGCGIDSGGWARRRLAMMNDRGKIIEDFRSKFEG